LKLELPALTGGLTLRFNAVSNHSYTIQSLEVLGTSGWQRLQDIPPSPSNRLMELPNALGTNQQRYFRLVTPSLP